MTLGIGEEGEGESEIGNLGRREDGLSSELLGPLEELARVVDLDIKGSPDRSVGGLRPDRTVARLWLSSQTSRTSRLALSMMGTADASDSGPSRAGRSHVPAPGGALPWPPLAVGADDQALRDRVP